MLHFPKEKRTWHLYWSDTNAGYWTNLLVPIKVLWHLAGFPHLHLPLFYSLESIARATPWFVVFTLEKNVSRVQGLYWSLSLSRSHYPVVQVYRKTETRKEAEQRYRKHCFLLVFIPTFSPFQLSLLHFIWIVYLELSQNNFLLVWMQPLYSFTFTSPEPFALYRDSSECSHFADLYNSLLHKKFVWLCCIILQDFCCA